MQGIKSCGRGLHYTEKLTFVGLPTVRLRIFWGGGGWVRSPTSHSAESRPCSIGNSANILIARGRPASALPKVFLRYSAMVVVAFASGSENGGRASRWTRPHY